jgi:hypothetical protein
MLKFKLKILKLNINIYIENITLLQLLSIQFMAQIYHTLLFTCFGLMGPSSGTFGFYNRLFLFLLLSPHWPVFTHWECTVCMVFICHFVVKCIAYWMRQVLLKFIWAVHSSSFRFRLMYLYTLLF